MTALDLIRALRGELQRLRVNGQAAVPVDALDAYLKSAEASATATEDPAAAEQALARAAHEFEVWKAQAQMQHASALEHFKSVIEAGQTAIRSLIVINGGAAVALLAFLGNVFTKEPSGLFKFSVANVKLAMATFVFGVGFAGAATGSRYLAQFAYQRSKTTGHVVNAFSIALGLASLVAFFRGGLWAYWSFG